MLLEVIHHKHRILAAHLHIAAEIVDKIVVVKASHHIHRIRCQRIIRLMRDHIADHEVGIDLMPLLHRQRRRDELMMQCRKHLLRV